MDVELDLVNQFDSNTRAQLLACDELEQALDELPSANTYALLAVSERFCPLLRQSHNFEETRIHPILARSNPGFCEIFRRLCGEHIEDQDQAGQLLDDVRVFVIGDDRTKANEIGYVARGLFAPLRRHLAFDQEFVASMVRDELVRQIS